MRKFCPDGRPMIRCCSYPDPFHSNRVVCSCEQGANPSDLFQMFKDIEPVCVKKCKLNDEGTRCTGCGRSTSEIEAAGHHHAQEA